MKFINYNTLFLDNKLKNTKKKETNTKNSMVGEYKI